MTTFTINKDTCQIIFKNLEFRFFRGKWYHRCEIYRDGVDISDNVISIAYEMPCDMTLYFTGDHTPLWGHIVSLCNNVKHIQTLIIETHNNKHVYTWQYDDVYFYNMAFPNSEW